MTNIGVLFVPICEENILHYIANKLRMLLVLFKYIIKAHCVTNIGILFVPICEGNILHYIANKLRMLLMRLSDLPVWDVTNRLLMKK